MSSPPDLFVGKGNDMLNVSGMIGIKIINDRAKKNSKDEISVLPVRFSNGREDRTGAAVQDMLLAHAYCFKNNFTYGGACYENPDKPRPFLQTHKDLIEVLGLTDVIFFVDHCNRSDVLAFHLYMGADIKKLWTQPWMIYIQSLQSPESRRRPQIQVKKKVFIHIRRGDVDLCHETNRYLPNLYYEKLLLQYDLLNNNKIESITIYSEPWNQFHEPLDLIKTNLKTTVNITIDTESSSKDVWENVIQYADIFIMSKSSFSVIPALFLTINSNFIGKKTFKPIIYLPKHFWYNPLPQWTVVRKSIFKDKSFSVLNHYDNIVSNLSRRVCS